MRSVVLTDTTILSLLQRKEVRLQVPELSRLAVQIKPDRPQKGKCSSCAGAAYAVKYRAIIDATRLEIVRMTPERRGVLKKAANLPDDAVFVDWSRDPSTGKLTRRNLP